MKYIPQELTENVNVSRQTPLKELLLLLGGLIALLAAMYLGLGLTVDLVVARMPPGLEKHLGKLFGQSFADKAPTPPELRLQQLVNELVALSTLEAGAYSAHIIPFHKPNAFALPGGKIVILSALLREVDSENEMAFILAHELGHFAARDHLRGLGRGLVLTAISVFFLGTDNILTDVLLRSLMNMEMKFSQRQENQADLFALDLLNRRYGHIGGATDFFDKILKEEHRSRLQYFFATHPYPQDRIQDIQAQARQKGYAAGEKTPLHHTLTYIPEEQETEQKFSLTPF